MAIDDAVLDAAPGPSEAGFLVIAHAGAVVILVERFLRPYLIVRRVGLGVTVADGLDGSSLWNLEQSCTSMA